jgi:hypothetical protein
MVGMDIEPEYDAGEQPDSISYFSLRINGIGDISIAMPGLASIC